MNEFSIGDKVYYGNLSGEIVKEDTLTSPIPRYKVKLDKSGKLIWLYGQQLCKKYDPFCVLKDGEILTEDIFENKCIYKIITCVYNKKIFYIRTCDGHIQDFKELIAN